MQVGQQLMELTIRHQQQSFDQTNTINQLTIQCNQLTNAHSALQIEHDKMQEELKTTT